MPKPKKRGRTHCGVPERVVSRYGICEVACTPAKMRRCGYHRSRK